MKKILVTGSKGFVGRNLCAVLRQHEDIILYEYDVNSQPEELDDFLAEADCIIHLAGVNRPENPDEFETGNTGSIDEICLKLKLMNRSPKIVLSSSIQADLDNPYGISKRGAEELLQKFSEDTGAECVVHRFKNLFGMWCRPNYNSVTATFCHNIANNLPIQISDPAHEIDLTHIDDVVKAFINDIDSKTPGFRFAEPLCSTRITLGELAAKIQSFREMRTSLLLPDLNTDFDRALYGTYLTYLDEKKFEYGLDIKSDQRGSLAEFVKSPAIGQIFVSRTNPGVTRGDHYHHTKTEKFLVLEGEGVIRFRHIEKDEILEYPVCGENYQVVDIPPGYTHSIENIGKGVLVTLFWASEMFNPEKPDTCFEKV
ncbi:UDP-2-acetamido-2,6-beta-L-arabino-hexul-4-ose reductase [Desulfocicer vacuolatum DSM 3385]|uniref:UDP-2-acetamido-2,6-beta-L-arabino-hexul-4-ose reductase n=1 Tax=Desulfocicer vacuolatum DSM 3385 TaxID=1121400 RepID=A0A1W1Z4G1_9BACT|nr:NAD-dependent epimerase/dehydratase family protein [Desulfocicer vacuolatum]SMC43357.1 UDP-2-acetamido-2,6-beta-L-arabino-hexul-4-ose reductase [Desulfocicer vacuolatum DSM 3385]